MQKYDLQNTLYNFVLNYNQLNCRTNCANNKHNLHRTVDGTAGRQHRKIVLHQSGGPAPSNRDHVQGQQIPGEGVATGRNVGSDGAATDVPRRTGRGRSGGVRFWVGGDEAVLRSRF